MQINATMKTADGGFLRGKFDVNNYVSVSGRRNAEVILEDQEKL